MYLFRNYKLLFIILFTLNISLAYTQNCPPENERKEVKLYQDDVGIWMESDYLTMHVGGLFQIDGDYFTNTDEGKSTFVLRRARIFLEGKIYNMFRYLVMGRWDFWTARVHDVFIETMSPKWAQVRIGYTKTPFGMENLYNDYLWDFTEKSIGTTNFIQRDTGVQVYGLLWDNLLEYHLGIYNGRFALPDNNNSKDLIGRIVISPLQNCDFLCGRFEHLFVGASGLLGKETENITGNQIITGSGNINGAGIPFYTFAGTTAAPVLQNAQKVMWEVDLEWLYGPYAIRAEYQNIDWGNISRTLNAVTVRRPFTVYSWFVQRYL
jgi:phosphate-selective porin